MSNKPKIIIIVGPTAAGKTDLGIKLAQSFNGVIISADSRQMYQDFDIGTAKIIGERKQVDDEAVVVYEGIDHYLIDNLFPTDDYTVAHFKQDCDRIISKIIKQGKVPIIVGGTGLYVQTLTDNLNIPEVSPDYELRQDLEINWQTKASGIIEKLQQQCPNLNAQTDLANPRRVIRAWEICQAVGDISKTKTESEYDFLLLGVTRDRDELYARINQRVDQMMVEGLLDEVTKLYEQYGEKVTPMTGIGYRQFLPYLANQRQVSLNQAIETLKRDTRHYAKRQLTWWRRDARIQWVDDLGTAQKKVTQFIDM